MEALEFRYMNIYFKPSNHQNFNNLMRLIITFGQNQLFDLPDVINIKSYDLSLSDLTGWIILSWNQKWRIGQRVHGGGESCSR